MTTLYGWGPMFGIQSPSPFVAKADIQMQMFDIPFDRAIANLESVTKHKAPYVEDEGTIIQDSTFIRWHFEEKLGVDLDEGLSAEQRAVACAIERTVEGNLNWINTYERWLEVDNFERGPVLFFNGVPEPMRAEVANGARDALRANIYAQGIGRHSRDERHRLAKHDIDAVAAYLGDKAFIMGGHPTAVDAPVYGVMSACSAPIFDTPLKDMVAGHPNLVAFLSRMEDRFYAENRWPSMMMETEAA